MKQSKISPSAFFLCIIIWLYNHKRQYNKTMPKQQTLRSFHIFVFIFTIPLLTQFGI